MTLTRLIAVGISLIAVIGAAGEVFAQEAPAPAPAPAEGEEAPNAIPGVGDMLDVIDKATAPKPGEEGDWSAPVKLVVAFTALALLPSLMVMMTSFTRIVIVLAFIRRALTTQNIPPTIAIIGLALFLTLFTMSPTLEQINAHAVQPYLQDKLAFDVACETGNEILKEFMIRQTRQEDLEMFVELAGIESPKTTADVPVYVAIPAFAISEFLTAFKMGCLLFIPFLLIDLVTAAILLSAGMMMLPPAMVSLPFKIILFVMVDGWRLIAKTLVTSFR